VRSLPAAAGRRLCWRARAAPRVVSYLCSGCRACFSSPKHSSPASHLPLARALLVGAFCATSACPAVRKRAARALAAAARQVAAGGSLSNTLVALARLGAADDALRASGPLRVGMAAVAGSDPQVRPAPRCFACARGTRSLFSRALGAALGAL